MTAASTTILFLTTILKSKNVPETIAQYSTTTVSDVEMCETLYTTYAVAMAVLAVIAAGESFLILGGDGRYVIVLHNEKHLSNLSDTFS